MMKIVSLVAFAHIFAAVSLSSFYPVHKKALPKKAVVVQTFMMTSSEKSSPKDVAAEKPIHPPQHDTPRTPQTLRPRDTPNPAPTSPATPPHPPEYKKTPRKIPNPTAQSGPSQKKQLIAMMQESLHTLTQGTPSQPNKVKPGPIGKVGALASETFQFTANYEEELVYHLESFFTFPEKGEVKIKLTLTREGGVQKLEILKSSSEKNKKYIESNLKTCFFPPFGKQFKGEESHTFTITLTSENSD